MNSILNYKNKILEIKKKELFLRCLKPKDISEEYIDWLNDIEITRYTEQRFYKHGYETTQSYIEKKYVSNLDLLFGIFLKSTHIGNIKLGPINFLHKNSEISFFIGKKNFMNKGIMTQVINYLVNFSFNNLNLEKITAGCYSNNLNSQKLLLKCGFIQEGKKKKQVIYQKKRIDVYIYGILKNGY